MTKQSLQRIACPDCKFEQDFVVWETINATLNPELKEQLMTGQLTSVTCSSCGETSQIVYPLLYHDMVGKYWIWWLPGKPQSSAPQMDELRSVNRTDITQDYICRTVRELNDLLEKIRIFDDGLDDRILEILKAFMQYGNVERLSSDVRGMMYYDGLVSGPSGIRQIQLLSIGAERSATVTLKPDAYSDIRAKFGPLFPDKSSTLGQWLEVDQEYILSFMEDFTGRRR